MGSVTKEREELSTSVARARQVLHHGAEPPVLLIFLNFEIGSCKIAQAGLQTAILLPQAPKQVRLQVSPIKPSLLHYCNYVTTS